MAKKMKLQSTSIGKENWPTLELRAAVLEELRGPHGGPCPASIGAGDRFRRLTKGVAGNALRMDDRGVALAALVFRAVTLSGPWRAQKRRASQPAGRPTRKKSRIRRVSVTDVVDPLVAWQIAPWL